MGLAGSGGIRPTHRARRGARARTLGAMHGVRWRRGLLRGLLVLGGAWVLATTVLLVLGALAAADAEDALRRLEEDLDLAALVEGDTALVREAEEALRRADRRLSHPLADPFELLPVVGRQLRAAQALTGSTSELMAAASTSLATVDEQTAGGIDAGGGSVRLLEVLERELESLLRAVDDVDLGPGDALVGPLRTGRQEMEERLIELRARLVEARGVVRAGREVLTGPTSLLVLAANNAEMRVGSGMFLSVGRVEVRDGSFTASDFEPAAALALDEAVPIPEELARLWGWARPGREWRNLGFSARFPVNAALAARMWEAAGHAPVDGVLAIDVIGLRQLLRVTGPVDVDGRRVGAGGVVDLLMHDQYVDVRADDPTNEARREALSDLVGAVVERLGTTTADPSDLVAALRRAQQGRHVLLWSTRGDHQRAWEHAGLGGDLDDRSLLVAVANAGGDKLDQFLDVDVEVDTRSADAGGALRVTLGVDVENRTPAGEPSYIVGGDRDARYVGIVVAALPAAASEVVVQGGPVVASGPDGPSDVVAAGIEVPRDGSTTVEISFTLPVSVAASVTLVADARVPPTEWIVGDAGPVSGEVPATVDLREARG